MLSSTIVLLDVKSDKNSLSDQILDLLFCALFHSALALVPEFSLLCPALKETCTVYNSQDMETT